MKKLLTNVLLTVALLLSTSAFAQVMVKGKVVDKKDAPLAGASVIIKGTTVGATTNSNGFFSFETSQTGPAQLVVSFIGYQTQTIATDLKTGENNFHFILQEISSGLNEVVVTATNTRRTQIQSPLSISTFKPKTLERLTASSQADILRTVPGITAEGGGGEVASNIFVRGLPSGGQYQFTPIMLDGFPILSTFGMNSSAQDVYFRTDLDMRSLEFVRGGVSTLYGVGSVAGIISYTSKTGSPTPERNLNLEWADRGRYKADLFASGPVGGANSNLYYAIAGTYRYDNGPLVTGLPTEGVQFRGNLKKVTKHGVITLYAQYIDDKVQFFLPLPLNGSDRSRATGNDGKPVFTTQTNAAADFAYPTPGGYFESPIRNGVYTKGGFLMLDVKQELGNNWRFDSKLKYARYKHQFNLFLDGSGVSGAAPVETQSEYVATRLPGITNYSFTYDNTGMALKPTDKLFENRILDRSRPMKDMTGEFKFSKEITGKKVDQTITFGAFLSRAEAGDFDVITRYLGAFNDKPQMVNLTYTTPGGQTMDYTKNGVSGRAIAYTNKYFGSNKQALYFTNEMVISRLRLDYGFRVEHTVGDVNIEGNQTYTMSNDPTQGANLNTVKWGNGKWTRGSVSATDFAFAIAGLYSVSERSSVYLNFSKGFFFPQLRTVKFHDGIPQSYSTEKIYQTEGGWKYGTKHFVATSALYYVVLRNRRQVDFVNAPGGGVVENVDLVGTSTVGLELTWNWTFVKHTHFYGNFTYQRHRYDQFQGHPEYVGNWLRRQPRMLSMFGVSYDNGKFDANLSDNYMGKKYTSDNNAILLDPINIVRIDAGYTFPLGKQTGKSWRLGVSVFNLFNDAGVTEGSPRLGNNQTIAEYFVGRPILPRRIFVRASFNL
jgi:iron complex outermembrane receptor protein